jgi:hypothetical protein
VSIDWNKVRQGGSSPPTTQPQPSSSGINWGAVKRGAAPAPQTPPAKNPVIYSGRIGAPPGVTPPFDEKKAIENTKRVVTGVSNALDYQAEKVRRAMVGHPNDYPEQMKAIREKIPGLESFYEYNPHTDFGVPAIDQPLDRIQDFGNGILQNVIDAAINIPIDPLTYETLGAGALMKTPIGIAARAAAARSLNGTMAGRAAFKALNWGGAAAIKRAATTHGGRMLPAIEEIEGVQGAGHQATSEGDRWAAHVKRRTDQIVNGVNPTTRKKVPGAALTDAEKKRVAQELNGEEHTGTEGQYAEGEEPKLAPLTPREQAAYRQLRTLTALDWKTRQATGLSIALRSSIKDKALRDEVAGHFRSGQPPIVPEPAMPRIKKPYGPPIPRQRAAHPNSPPDYKSLYDQTVATMSHAEKVGFSKALTDSQAFAKLPPELQYRVEEIKTAMNQQLRGVPESVTPLQPRPRYKLLPTNAAEIEHMAKVRKAYTHVLGLVSKSDEGGLMRYRKHYMPFAHYADEGEGREAFTVNPAEHFDPRNVQRNDLKVKSPKQLEQGFEAMADNLGRQVRTKALNDNLGSLLDDPAISGLFKEEIAATGNKLDDWGKTKKYIRAIIGWPRASLIGITPGHAWNEIDMAMNTVPLAEQPQFFAKAMTLAKKIFAAQTSGNEKEYYRLTAPGRRLGAGVGNFAERKPFFQKVPGLRWWTKNMNNLVWSVSEGIRQTYAERLLASGEAKTPLQAGGMAEKRLVDYQYRTPLQNLARHIAPFGTYRGGIPGAVAGGVARSPLRAGFLNRATGGVMYGDKPQPGQGGWEAFTPTAEVGRLANFVPGERFTESGPGDFVRGSLGAPIAAGINAAQDVLAPSSAPKHWATYGQGWLPRRLPNGHLDLGYLFSSAIAGVPEAEQILEANGIGRFQWKGILQELQRQFTRTQYVSPTAPTAALPLALPATPASAPPSGGIDWNALRPRP